MGVNMLANTIQSIMTTDIASLPTGAPLREAIARMSEKNISCIIINEDHRPVGIVTERDVLRIAARNIDIDRTKVEELMSSPVRTVSQNMDIYEAAIYLQKNNFRRIVIVDGDGRLLGLVTQTDLKNHLGAVYYVKLKTIESIMTGEVVTADCNENLSALICRMSEHNLGCIVICKQGRPLGILTERDVTHLMARNEDTRKLSAGEGVKFPLVSISKDTSIYEATRLMKQKDIRRLVVVDENNQLLGLITESDIVKHLETGYLESLRSIVERDRTYINTLKEGIFECTPSADGIFTWINHAGAKLLGYKSSQKILGKRLRDIFADTQELERLINAVQTKGIAKDFHTVLQKPSGRPFYVEGSFYFVKDEDGKVTCLEGTLRDITERKKMEDKIKQKVERQTVEIRRKNRELERMNVRLQALSTQDGLTGINNFRYFTEMLEMEFKKAKRYDLPLACIILDIDDFKFINDRFGHAAGDLALIKTADLLKKLVRETDIVARYGGDEFTVILPNTDLESANAVGNKIILAFRRYRLRKNSELLGRISLSIGVSAMPDGRINTHQQLVEYADKSMYRAKEHGKNNVCTCREL